MATSSLGMLTNDAAHIDAAHSHTTEVSNISSPFKKATSLLFRMEPVQVATKENTKDYQKGKPVPMAKARPGRLKL